MGPTGAPVPLTGRSPSCARPDACLLCWRPDRHGQVEKVTGLRGARGGVALWKANRVRSSRCGLTGPESRRADDERPGGRWGAGRRVSEWRSSSLSPDTFPGDDLRPPGTAVTYRELDLKEKKEVVEEAENGRDAPANGNAVRKRMETKTRRPRQLRANGQLKTMRMTMSTPRSRRPMRMTRQQKRKS
ncbi:prothymosin alpha isoform X2 [Zalophus californianus]|uniref:Prothymosin alpha n=1 Tax=Zalophus californianus TaxID=9704 RepID=A0A6J2CVR4_ZALCA|nr:prothymosin alpha isoform X2 [Zalophus californianus]